eukprot:TRINITY_DN251_c0_g1_i5.p1 TRINITY_DN251_c0_g1~~TRINITY_DN251_c0_g1_i5.p1  ORF type:complete len:649 (-),score=160.63 TRINITY_DN251_c0_g1_i5:2354-4051(-)
MGDGLISFLHHYLEEYGFPVVDGDIWRVLLGHMWTLLIVILGSLLLPLEALRRVHLISPNILDTIEWAILYITSFFKIFGMTVFELIALPCFAGFSLDVVSYDFFIHHLHTTSNDHVRSGLLNALQGRILLVREEPWLLPLVYWPLGYAFLLHFGIHVDALLSILRRGVLWFILRPAPDDHEFSFVRHVISKRAHELIVSGFLTFSFFILVFLTTVHLPMRIARTLAPSFFPLDRSFKVLSSSLPQSLGLLALSRPAIAFLVGAHAGIKRVYRAFLMQMGEFFGVQEYLFGDGTKRDRFIFRITGLIGITWWCVVTITSLFVMLSFAVGQMWMVLWGTAGPLDVWGAGVGALVIILFAGLLLSLANRGDRYSLSWLVNMLALAVLWLGVFPIFTGIIGWSLFITHPADHRFLIGMGYVHLKVYIWMCYSGVFGPKAKDIVRIVLEERSLPPLELIWKDITMPTMRLFSLLVIAPYIVVEKVLPLVSQSVGFLPPNVVELLQCQVYGSLFFGMVASKYVHRLLSGWGVVERAVRDDLFLVRHHVLNHDGSHPHQPQQPQQTAAVRQ